MVKPLRDRKALVNWVAMASIYFDILTRLNWKPLETWTELETTGDLTELETTGDLN